MSNPKTIFKYQSTSMINISNFKQHGLYMASPRLFNDPYDCSVRFRFEDLKEDQLDFFRKNRLKFSNGKRFIEEVNSSSNETLKAILLKGARFALKESIANFLNNYGVCCFSEVKDDILMWGHYSESFKGYCLEFRTEYEPFSKLHKVIYRPDFPTINSLDIYLNEEYSHVNDLFCTKSDNWANEKEWRVLHKEAGTLFHYEPQCLKAIYFGPKIDNSLKEIFCLILKGQNPNVELWQGELSENSFGINFHRFYYNTYIEGKNMGLIK